MLSNHRLDKIKSWIVTTHLQQLQVIFTCLVLVKKWAMSAVVLPLVSAPVMSTDPVPVLGAVIEGTRVAAGVHVGLGVVCAVGIALAGGTRLLC